jgi:ABC-type nitrate/sulfonate/bicarbonate transport system substrate-binding protein
MSTTLSVAFRDDPSRLAVLYGLRHGLVSAGDLDIDLRFWPMSRLVAGWAPGNVDLLEASTLSLASGAAVTATMVSSGLRDRGSVMVFVPAASGLHSPAELRGRSIAQQPGGASSTLMLRFVLQQKYGLRLSAPAEIEWVVVPQDEMTDALLSGRVDAAMQNSYEGWLAMQHPELRLLYQATSDFVELTGSRPMNTGLLTGPEIVAEKQAAIRALNMAFARSVSYTNDHRHEVFESVASEAGVPAEYLEWWWDTFDVLWGPVRRDHLLGVRGLWDAAVATGDLPAAPDRVEDFCLLDD